MQTAREYLYDHLPAVAPPDELYDFDVLVARDGKFLTVEMAWHGPTMVEVLKCMPGVHALDLLGKSYGTNLPTIEIPAQAPPVLLLGRFRSVDDRLTLKRPDGLSTDEEKEVRFLFPGYGRFEHVELVAENRLQSGDVIVAEDGHPYEVTGNSMLSLLDAATWRPVAVDSPVPLRTYLEQRDMSELPLARLS